MDYRYVDTLLNRTAIFEWSMASLVIKKGHEYNTCYIGIVPSAQNMWTVVGSIGNTIGRAYVITSKDSSLWPPITFASQFQWWHSKLQSSKFAITHCIIRSTAKIVCGVGTAKNRAIYFTVRDQFRRQWRKQNQPDGAQASPRSERAPQLASRPQSEARDTLRPSGQTIAWCPAAQRAPAGLGGRHSRIPAQTPQFAPEDRVAPPLVCWCCHLPNKMLPAMRDPTRNNHWAYTRYSTRNLTVTSSILTQVFLMQVFRHFMSRMIAFT